MKSVLWHGETRAARLLSFFHCYILLFFSGQFDRKWYARQYPDVVASGGDPLKHYIRYGAGELRNPNREFDTGFYLASNPDVARRGINPLLHYVRFGQKEGRAPNQREYAGTLYQHHAMVSCRNREWGGGECFPDTALIIAEISLPQCLKYRVHQMRDLLKDLGFQVSVVDWRDFSRVLTNLQCCSLVIFYRVPLYHGHFAKYFAECTRLGTTTGYDIDDPIFSTCTVADNANLEHLDDSIARSLLNDAPMYLVPLFSCDFCVVSTAGMRRLLKKTGYGKPVVIRRNALDEETISIAGNLPARSSRIGHTPVRILYATPSLAHQHDFLLIENVLVDLLTRYSGRVRLLTVGTLPLSESLVTVSRWIDNEQSTDYAGFLEILSGVDINLVPLASNAFNATKSNIKFLDAAAVEVPSVCSPVGDYQRLPDGECCFLASTEKEWLEKIVQLIEDDALRERMGKKAAAWAVKVYGMHAVDEELAVFLREKI